MDSQARSWIYLGTLAALIVLVNGATLEIDNSQPDDPGKVIFMTVAAAAMSMPAVRLERGLLSLNGIISCVAAIQLNPLDATVSSLGVGIAAAQRGSWPILGNSLITALGTSLTSLAVIHLSSAQVPSIGVRILAVLIFNIANFALTASALAIRQGESPVRVLRHNLAPSFLAAFAYFGLAALLMSFVLDGSLLGYLLATIVCILALALTDTIAGRRVRRVLESELSDADRHLFHSRAVEGVVHNLRNHVATAYAYLKEIDSRRLESIDRENLQSATEATSDAVTVLRDLAQGATPRVSYAVGPVDLNEFVSRAVSMARARAHVKDVQLAVSESPADVKVKADPLLMREVMTNLLNNAIDAVAEGGHVEVTTGRRNNGWPYVSIADNGPGVNEDRRHHLFEPHFTTKEGGTGLGLFMSYGIVREHQGDLLYSGSNRGAVFTVTLPPFAG